MIEITLRGSNGARLILLSRSYCDAADTLSILDEGYVSKDSIIESLEDHFYSYPGPGNEPRFGDFVLDNVAEIG